MFLKLFQRLIHLGAEIVIQFALLENVGEISGCFDSTKE